MLQCMPRSEVALVEDPLHAYHLSQDAAVDLLLGLLKAPALALVPPSDEVCGACDDTRGSSFGAKLQAIRAAWGSHVARGSNAAQGSCSLHSVTLGKLHDIDDEGVVRWSGAIDCMRALDDGGRDGEACFQQHAGAGTGAGAGAGAGDGAA